MFWRLGLVGYPLEHSLSPLLHHAALHALGWQGEYRLYPVPDANPAMLRALVEGLRQGEIHGLNVTLPHKIRMMQWVDDVSSRAQGIGAANTLGAREGRVWAENTDAVGFWRDVHRRLPLDEHPRWHLVVLGAGGAARAAVYAGLQVGWPVTVVARRETALQNILQSMCRVFPEAPIQGIRWNDFFSRVFESSLPVLIVNATPVGMFPHTEASPWLEGHPFPENAAVYDMVYRPGLTRLVRQARSAGLPAVTGLGMLVEQAVEAFSLWTQAPLEQVRSAMEQAARTLFSPEEG